MDSVEDRVAKYAGAIRGDISGAEAVGDYIERAARAAIRVADAEIGTSTSDAVQVSLPNRERALVYFTGGGTALFLDDNMTRAQLRDHISAPVARAVFAARFRAFADMLEPSPEDLLTSAMRG